MSALPGTPQPESGRFARLRRFLAARLDPKAYLGLHATVGLTTASLAVWSFGALLEEVLDDATLVHWDLAAAAWVHAHATPLGLQVFDAITQLGSPTAMGVLAVVGCVVLWRQRHGTLLTTWIAAFAGGALLELVLKASVHRTRPEYGSAYLHGHSYSFPSGHAMGATIGFGMLAHLAVEHWRTLRGRRGPAWAIALACAVLVGISRVYLGVHYPSDVAGGWAAGSAWLAVCVTGEGIARRHAAERPAGSAEDA